MESRTSDLTGLPPDIFSSLCTSEIILYIPVLLLQAGEDAIVTAKEQNEFAENASHCKLISIKNAYHEMLIESDEHRNEVLDEVLKFFEQYI